MKRRAAAKAPITTAGRQRRLLWTRTCLWTYLGPLAAWQEKISAALFLARSGSVPQKLNLHLADQTRLEPDLLQITTKKWI